MKNDLPELHAECLEQPRILHIDHSLLQLIDVFHKAFESKKVNTKMFEVVNGEAIILGIPNKMQVNIDAKKKYTILYLTKTADCAR